MAGERRPLNCPQQRIARLASSKEALAALFSADARMCQEGAFSAQGSGRACGRKDRGAFSKGVCVCDGTRGSRFLLCFLQSDRTEHEQYSVKKRKTVAWMSWVFK